ncbi:MAG: hypothetical protein VX546_12075 [Myxococcota bacterium]|nr:hypothetical protein [Myxococcota bacterium]
MTCLLLPKGCARVGLLSGILLALAGSASANHLAREDPPEPIFTQRAFIENDIETAIDWGRGSGTQDIEIGAGITWIVHPRFQFGAEFPLGIAIPDKGSTRADLSDINFSGKLLLCCEEPTGYTFAAARVDVSPPTGNRDRDIGGTGSFGFSIDLGYGLTVVEALQDLSIQFQASYFQQMRLSSDQLETAESLGLSKTREKRVLWNLAFVQPLFGGRFSPSFEILGTSVVDAVQSSDEGSSLELAAGFWVVPFDDDHPLSNLSIGLGGRVPVTNRRDEEGGATLIFEFAFESSQSRARKAAQARKPRP